VSGLALTPMMLGVTVTSIVAGQVTTKTGRYKVFIFVLAWFIKEVPLRGRAPAAEATSEQPELVS
jgi:MFS family permease